MSATTAVQPSVPPAAPPLMTAEEFARRHGNDRVELVKGIVVEMPMPFPKHGMICAIVTRLLANHVADHDLGRVMSNDSFVQTRQNPPSVRGADVCYWSYERLPRGEVPDGLLPGTPDLIVEVRSPTDRWTVVFTKVAEYLEAGVRVVIVLDALTVTASVYRPDELQQIFDNGDTLTVPDVLPGFAVPVKKFFEQLR